MAHVFISFVEENTKLAAWIVQQLRANGLDPWFSKDDGRIIPGDQWKQTLRTAIREGGFYLPVFTKEWAARERTVANEELMLAVEEARLRGLHRRWFVPVKVDDQPLPDIELGGGRSLADLHYVNIPTLGWERGLRMLMQALGVEHPVLEMGEPLAPGFGSEAEIIGGLLTYRNTNPPLSALDRVHFAVTSGWIRRNERGEICARFSTRAPYEDLQNLNTELGFDTIDVLVDDRVISVDPSQLTRFWYDDGKDSRAPGSKLWSLESREYRTDVAMEQQTGFEAFAHLNQHGHIVGTFTGFVDTQTEFAAGKMTFDGDFDLELRTMVRPPSD